jgi:NodT family efflux transporter outer membrane factor (OMF) lipoprotein
VKSPAVPWLGVALLCTACAQAPSKIPPVDVPTGFDGSTASTAPWPSERWYGEFASPQLTQLIEAAASGNLDVSQARFRVAQADARARQAGAAILPSVDALGNANYLAGHSSNGSAHETDWSALLSASYEIDFWGKNRAALQAAGYAAAGARAERDTVALTSLAGVADGYFEVQALDERLAIAHENREAAHRVLEVVQARFSAGLASPVELATQRAALAGVEIAISQLEQQRAEALASLALLLGRAPENFQIEAQPLAQLHEPSVGAGLPSELLRRRPDVAMAEANLQSAHADVAAAHAALYPSISLTAQAGVQNPALNAAVLSLPGTGPTLNLGTSVTQAIFDHGRLRAVQAEAEAKEAELLAAYRAAILAALRDVETALAALAHLNEQRPFEQESLSQSEQAFDGAKLRYQAGSGDYLTLLDAQRTLYAARDQEVQYRLARLQTLVGLCKALGGGWRNENP